MTWRHGMHVVAEKQMYLRRLHDDDEATMDW